MDQNPLPSTADRIALTNMFKDIAEYGRKVRQRRQDLGTNDEQHKQVESHPTAESPKQVQPVEV